MILITIFRWGHKPTYNWGGPSCSILLDFIGFESEYRKLKWTQQLEAVDGINHLQFNGFISGKSSQETGRCLPQIWNPPFIQFLETFQHDQTYRFEPSYLPI